MWTHNILEEIFPFYWLPMAWPTIPVRNKQYLCGNLFDWLCMMDESWSHYFRWGNRSIQSSFQHFIPFFSLDWPIIFSSSLLQELSTQETNILGTYCDVSVSVSYLLDFCSKYTRPDCEGSENERWSNRSHRLNYPFPDSLPKLHYNFKLRCHKEY